MASVRRSTNFINNAVKLTDRSTESLRLYFSELSADKHKPLSIIEEEFLFSNYKLNKCFKSKERIICSNMKFVISMAKKYIVYDVKFANDKVTLEDLISEGNIGLIKAFDTFDTTKGVRFLTYAAWYIRQSLQTYLNETIVDIPQPANRYIIDVWIKRSIYELNNNKIENPSPEQIVDMYNHIKKQEVPKLTVNLYAQINEDKKPFISASTSISGKDGSETTLSELFSADYKTIPDHNIVHESSQKSILKIVTKSLTELESNIIQLHYGMNGNEEKTLDQIADITGYTRARIGQILKIALEKLKTKKEQLIKSI
jgi:RNA polymerase primary sigma factor